MQRGWLSSLSLVSSPALACAVCGGGPDAGNESYVVMSVIISLLPLLMVGGIVGWVVLKARAAKGKVERAQHVSPPA